MSRLCKLFFQQSDFLSEIFLLHQISPANGLNLWFKSVFKLLVQIWFKLLAATKNTVEATMP
jgi:hypothetical protein